MPVLEIPTQPSIPHYTQQTELDGKTYTFEFEYIERGDIWLLHLGDQDWKPLVNGIRLTPEWPLLRRDPDVMGGELVMLGARLVYLSQ